LGKRVTAAAVSPTACVREGDQSEMLTKLQYRMQANFGKYKRHFLLFKALRDMFPHRCECC
jgi:hypothetical protein